MKPLSPKLSYWIILISFIAASHTIYGEDLSFRNPLIVKSQIVNNADLLADIQLTVSDTSLSCGNQAVITTTIIPRLLPTSDGDTIEYVFPPGIKYLGDFENIENCAQCVIQTDSSGITVKLPKGLIADQPISFRYTVVVDGSGCGTAPINAQLVRSDFPVNCEIPPCPILREIVATASTQHLEVLKPDLTLSAPVVISGKWTADADVVTALSFSNLGGVPSEANLYQVEFTCSSSVQPFHVETISAGIPIGNTIRDTIQVTFPATCAVGDQITATINPVKADQKLQCLCARRSVTFEAALPVELASFVGKPSDCSIELYWKTTMEHMSSHFIIEESTDAATFKMIGKVPSENNTYGSTYQFRDDSRTHGPYYRLKSVDFDDSHSYSGIVYVQRNCLQEKVTLYPNPSENILIINNASDWETIDVFSSNGTRVAAVRISPNEKTIRVDVSKLVMGSYAVLAIGNGGRVLWRRRFEKL